MIGRLLWWLVSRAFEVPSITEEMLDAVQADLAAEAAERLALWGVVLPAGET